MKRPINKVYKFPKLHKIAPTMKNTLFHNKVKRLPFNSDGLLPIKHPIQAPKMVKEVDTWASTKDSKINRSLVNKSSKNCTYLSYLLTN